MCNPSGHCYFGVVLLLTGPPEVSPTFPKRLQQATACDIRCLGVLSLPQCRALKIGEGKTREGLQEAHSLRELETKKEERQEKRKEEREGGKEDKRGISRYVTGPVIQGLLVYYRITLLPDVLGHREMPWGAGARSSGPFQHASQHPACTGQLPGRTEMPRAGPPLAEAYSPEASAGTNALGWEAM